MKSMNANKTQLQSVQTSLDEGARIPSCLSGEEGAPIDQMCGV